MEKNTRGDGRVYRHGNSWWIDVSFKGTRIRERVCKALKPESKKNQDPGYKIAKAKLAEKYLEIVKQEELSVEKEEVSMTFKELSSKYIEEYAKHKKKSWEKSDKCYLAHLNEYFDDMHIKAISPEHVLRYQIKRQSEVGASSVNHEISLMRSIYNLAIDFWKRPDDAEKPLFSGQNPARMRKKSALKKLKEIERDRSMTKGELVRFLQVADAEIADYALFAICTGLRKGEQVGLSAEKNKWDENTIKLHEYETKNGEDRLVPLCNIAKKILERRGWDFSRDIMRKDNKSKQDKYPFGKAIKKAKIDNFHWHDFRRTFSTYMEECGVSEERRRRIMGHAGNKMTERYTKVALENLLKEVRKLDSYLMEIIPSSNFSGTGKAQVEDSENRLNKRVVLTYLK